MQLAAAVVEAAVLAPLTGALSEYPVVQAALLVQVKVVAAVTPTIVEVWK